MLSHAQSVSLVWTFAGADKMHGTMMMATQLDLLLSNCFEIVDWWEGEASSLIIWWIFIRNYAASAFRVNIWRFSILFKDLLDCALDQNFSLFNRWWTLLLLIIIFVFRRCPSPRWFYFTWNLLLRSFFICILFVGSDGVTRRREIPLLSVARPIMWVKFLLIKRSISR